MDYNLGAPESAALAVIFFICFSSFNQGMWVYSDQSSSSKLQIPAVEVDALLEFKANYIHKGSQHLLWSWNSSSTSTVCESWVGITCTASSTGKIQYNHINGINLGSFGLAGSLAPHLGNLSFLSTLDLSDNMFTGGIPAQLQGCTSLELLYLHNNSLTGAIPASLGYLSSLEVLSLRINHLSGHIPLAILSNCTSLLELRLWQNAFTGSFPADIGLRLPKLQYLNLWSNNFTGAILGNCNSLAYIILSRNKFSGPIPPSLGNCTSLIGLDLSENQLTGPIPSQLGLLNQVQHILLNSNMFTGHIPPSLGNCTSLIDLDLVENQLTGPIPSQLGFLNQVKHIFMFSNTLTGVIPPSLANCTNLTGLEFDDNQLTGQIPAELSNLSHLELLYLGENRLTGAIPPKIAAMCTNLTEVYLSYNQLTGPIPAEFGQLHRLQILWLYGNLLSGPLPSSLSDCMNLRMLDLSSNQLSGSVSQFDFSNLPSLQVLDLGFNHFTGEIPWHSLTNCMSLYGLDFSNNHLTGGIPSILGKFSKLKKLYLGGNLLQGEIPSSVDYSALSLLDVNLSFNRLNGSLPPSLVHAFSTLVISLDLSSNRFSGPLPIWLGQLVQVQTIDLSDNKFVGSIPESLGSCANLFTLNLSTNHLSGDLPLQLENITNLVSLDLSHNNFSGVLPSYLGTNLHHLRSLDVSFNNLTGPIPAHGLFNHLNASSFQGNPGLCGPILNRMCTDLQLPTGHHHRHTRVWQLRKWRGILLMSLGLLILLPVVVMLVLTVWRYCLLQHGKVKGTQFIGRLAGAKRYSAQELMEATQSYSENNILGEGGLSVVYKGVLRDGKIVAIKKMRDTYNGSHEALLREMQILRKLRHRNLVQVLGCVLNLDVKALVLEYMANGSLEHYLNMHQEHNNVAEEIDSSGLSYWKMVSRVAISLAKVLTYLHHEYDVPIIHGDVKPSNVLLDSDMEPHLADLGLAKLIDQGAEAVSLTADLKGTLGYMAPEYVLAARISTKVDVFAYGVVLLGMLTGRRPSQVVPAGLSLHEWVKSKLPSNDSYSIANMEEVLDACLLQRISSPCTTAPNTESPSIESLLRIGLACTMEHPNDRPTIRQVLGFLNSVNS